MMNKSTYQNHTLAPSTSPLSTNEGDPVPLSPDACANGDFRVELYTHAEIQFQRRRRYLQRASNITLRECVEQVVGGNRILHDIEIGRAFEQMLALSACVLCANLLTVDALDGQTLDSFINIYHETLDATKPSLPCLPP